MQPIITTDICKATLVFLIIVCLSKMHAFKFYVNMYACMRDSTYRQMLDKYGTTMLKYMMSYVTITYRKCNHILSKIDFFVSIDALL